MALERTHNTQPDPEALRTNDRPPSPSTSGGQVLDVLRHREKVEKVTSRGNKDIYSVVQQYMENITPLNHQQEHMLRKTMSGNENLRTHLFAMARAERQVDTALFAKTFISNVPIDQATSLGDAFNSSVVEDAKEHYNKTSKKVENDAIGFKISLSEMNDEEKNSIQTLINRIENARRDLQHPENMDTLDVRILETSIPISLKAIEEHEAAIQLNNEYSAHFDQFLQTLKSKRERFEEN